MNNQTALVYRMFTWYPVVSEQRPNSRTEQPNQTAEQPHGRFIRTHRKESAVMSLNFDYRNIKNFQENFPDQGEYLNGTFQSIVWTMMPIGMNEITEDNVEEVWWRVDFYMRLSNSQFLTAKNIYDAIGLKTNVGNETRASFKKRMLQIFDERWHTSVAKATEKVEDNA